MYMLVINTRFQNNNVNGLLQIITEYKLTEVSIISYSVPNTIKYRNVDLSISGLAHFYTEPLLTEDFTMIKFRYNQFYNQFYDILLILIFCRLSWYLIDILISVQH